MPQRKPHNPNVTPAGTLTVLRKIAYMSAVSDGLPVPVKHPELGRPALGEVTRWLLRQRYVECKRKGDTLLFKLTPSGIQALQSAELRVDRYTERQRKLRGW
jgi:hypothetical protein